MIRIRSIVQKVYIYIFSYHSFHSLPMGKEIPVRRSLPFPTNWKNNKKIFLVSEKRIAFLNVLELNFRAKLKVVATKIISCTFSIKSLFLRLNSAIFMYLFIGLECVFVHFFYFFLRFRTKFPGKVKSSCHRNYIMCFLYKMFILKI